jgi:hypothetical protein
VAVMMMMMMMMMMTMMMMLLLLLLMMMMMMVIFIHTCTLYRGGSFLLASSMDGRFLASVASEDPRDGRWSW